MLPVAAARYSRDWGAPPLLPPLPPLLRLTSPLRPAAVLAALHPPPTAPLQRKRTMKAMKTMVRTIRDWRIHRSEASIEELARRHNAVIRGWINYYGLFWYRVFSYRLYTALQSRLLKWAKSKYRIENRKAIRKLALIREQHPRMFAHWYMLRASNA